jgi:hypothetical protein
MSDRPGYGRAMVNGRSAIVDLNDNRIIWLSDYAGQLNSSGLAGQLGSDPLNGSGQLKGVYGPASSAPLSSPPVGLSPLSSTLVGPGNTSMNSAAAVAPGAFLPAGTPTSPAPYGRIGYGQAWVNGQMLLIDLSNNRVVERLR